MKYKEIYYKQGINCNPILMQSFIAHKNHTQDIEIKINNEEVNSPHKCSGDSISHS